MKRHFSILILSLLTITALLAGCSKDYESISEQDAGVIQNYIKAAGGSFQQYQASGVFYQVVKAGSGPSIDLTTRGAVLITVKGINNSFAALDTFAAFNRYGNYLGYLTLRGTKATETIPNAVLASGVRKGGSVRLLIPSGMLYGRNPSAKIQDYNTEIPGNTSLDVTFTFVDDSKQAQYDDLSIQKYIAKNSLTGFIKNSSGTYYKITAPGTLSPITVDSTITAEYTGKLFSGFVFDSRDSSSPLVLPLSSLIKGWQQTIPLIKQGGSIELIVPTANAYGLGETLDQNNGTVSIPAFSPLVFTIKVTDVTNQ